MVSDLSDSKEQDDGIWNSDGWLSAGRPKAQLLQEHHIQRCRHGSRRRLPTRRDGPSGSRSVNSRMTKADYTGGI